jgi:hypothetical protein
MFHNTTPICASPLALPLDMTVTISYTSPPIFQYTEEEEVDTNWETYSALTTDIDQDDYYYEYELPVIYVLTTNGRSVEEG